MDKIKETSAVFTELSREQLLLLRKQLQAELDKRDKYLKSETRITSELYRILSESFKEEGCSEDTIGDVLSSMGSSIWRICDLTLKNYKLAKSKKSYGRDTGTAPSCSGCYITCDFDKYNKMCSDIISVIEKYSALRGN